MSIRDFLTTRDVAELWTRERDAAERRAAAAAGRDPVERPPISMDTVREYVRLSTPAAPGSSTRHRYEHNKVPPPIHLDPQRMVWVPAPGQTMHQLRQALRRWYRDRDKNPPPTPGPTGEALQYLTIDDVARIWTEERQAAEDARARADGRDPVQTKPITRNTVKAYVWFSEKAPRGKPKNRYQDHPVPASTRLDRRRRVWLPDIGETLADVEQALRDWYNDPARPGQGVGGGRKPAKPRRRRTR